MTTATVAPSSAPPRTPWESRLPHWLPAVLVPVVVAIGGAIAEATGHLFFYVGDAPESFVPNWWHFGHQLRAGQWWLMEPAGWMGGNYAAEAAYNQWNPVSLIQYIQVSYFDDLSKAAALVITELLVLLAVGCYLLFRSYGASQWPAAAAAVAVPFTGFTLFYEAAGWPAGLTALTWVVFFWWAAHRQIARGGSPIVTWVFGLMAMTSGNPYAALGLIFVLLALAVELLIKKSWSRLVLLILTGALVGATAWLIFGPVDASGHPAPGARHDRKRHVHGAGCWRSTRLQLPVLPAVSHELGRRPG